MRNLDGDIAHKVAAKDLVGLEDRSEGTAGPHLDQMVLAGHDLAQETIFQRRNVCHGLLALNCSSL